MSIEDVIESIAAYGAILGLVSVSLPLLAWVLGFWAKKGDKGHWLIYVYACLIYLVCLPGILAVVLTAYHLFFLKANLLQVNILVYFAPIAVMITTLTIIHKRVNFDDVPGFDRIQGLMILMGICFVLALVIQKSFVVFGFFAGFRGLLLLAGIAWVFYRMGKRLLLK
ncbi:MAG: hypothetical protein CMP10_19245 [Zetaproteobacteria bacterium]|nr:hypothetical protein [Pseudobdellovibrionaceae bacterium]